MRQPPKTFIFVRAALDVNDVPYLVADPRAPARKVGIRRVAEAPKDPQHFAEHFEPHGHVVDVSNILHLAHFRKEQEAGTLEILGQCQAKDAEEAALKFAALVEPKAEAQAAKAPAPVSPASAASAPKTTPASPVSTAAKE
jgi:hypothetical protein